MTTFKALPENLEDSHKTVKHLINLNMATAGVGQLKPMIALWGGGRGGSSGGKGQRRRAKKNRLLMSTGCSRAKCRRKMGKTKIFIRGQCLRKRHPWREWKVQTLTLNYEDVSTNRKPREHPAPN